MSVNWFCFIVGIYYLISYFFIKKKHKLGFIIYGECLRKAKNIKDRRGLEYELSSIELIFGIALILGSIIKPNILIEIVIWIVFGIYVFKLFHIRKKILNGYYD